MGYGCNALRLAQNTLLICTQLCPIVSVLAAIQQYSHNA